MGAFLDHPKIEKEKESGGGRNAHLIYKYGMASMQGWRIDMEDKHCVVPSIDGFSDWSFFAVFDGHAGGKVAEYSAQNLLTTILATDQFKALIARRDQQAPSALLAEEEKALVREGLMEGFLKLDREMQENQRVQGDDRERSGTTAVTAILTPHHYIFANLGDSRGILCRKSELIATEDHKPYLEAERERIVKAGGSVMIQRVNGSLAVSRAFGDFEYKSVQGLPQNQQLVSPEPDVQILDRMQTEDEFLVLACDGIYDVLENDELREIVRHRLSVLDDLEQVASQILDICLSKGSRDNMTLVLIVFDAAPKMNPEMAAEEKKWEVMTERKLKELIESPEAKATENINIDAETLTTWLKDKGSELDVAKPGGIHLARTVIHKVLEEKTSAASSHPNNNSIPSS